MKKLIIVEYQSYESIWFLNKELYNKRRLSVKYGEEEKEEKFFNNIKDAEEFFNNLKERAVLWEITAIPEMLKSKEWEGEERV